MTAVRCGLGISWRVNFFFFFTRFDAYLVSSFNPFGIYVETTTGRTNLTCIILINYQYVLPPTSTLIIWESAVSLIAY